MRKLYIAVFLTMLLAACSGGGGPTTPGEPVAVPKVAPETVVVDAATNAALSRYSFDNAADCLPDPPEPPLDAPTGKLQDVRGQPFVPCRGRFVFSSTTPQLASLKTGSILVSAPVDAKAPYGYLQKVTSVTSADGVVTVLTEQASLDEALIEGEFEQNLTLEPADLASLSLAPGVSVPGLDTQSLGSGDSSGVTLSGQDLSTLETFAFAIDTVLYDVDGNLSSTNDQVRLKGSFNLDTDNGISLGLKWKKFLGWPAYPKGITFRMAYGFSQSANIRVEADIQGSLEKEVELAQYTFSPIIFSVGPVPVVLIPSVKITADLKGNLTAKLAFGAAEHVAARAGFEYNGGFANINEFSKDFSKYADVPVVTGNAEAGLNLKGDILLYGLVGPYARVRASVALDAHVPRDPVWRLSVAAQGQVGIHADLLVKTLNYDAVIFDLPAEEFARSDPQPPTLKIIRPSNGSKVHRNSSDAWSGFCVTAQDLQQLLTFPWVRINGVSVENPHWTIVNNPNMCLDLPATTYAKVGPVTFKATLTNTYGQSVTDSVTVSVENVPPTPYIVKPAPGDILYDGQPVFLQGFVVSGSDEIACPLPGGATMTFRSDRSGDSTPSSAEFCSNPVMTLQGEGPLTLTLRATDTLGAPGEVKRTFNVLPAPTNYPTDVSLLEPSVDPSNRPIFSAGDTVNLRARLQDQDSDSLTYTWKLRPTPEDDLQTLFSGTATGASGQNGTEITYSFSTDLLPGRCNGLSGEDFEIVLEVSDGTNTVLGKWTFGTSSGIC